MENKFHKTLLLLLSRRNILAVIGVLLIYLSHSHAPSFLDSMENPLATLSVLFPPAKPLYVGMMAATGIGLIAGYRWAWWAEINLIFIRIILLSLALYWSHELARFVRLFDPLVVESYLGFTVGILAYLIYFRLSHKNLLKETQGSLSTRILFSLLTVAVLVIALKQYHSFLS
jgi:hypothetical protein